MVFGLWRCATNGDAIATSEVLAMVVLQSEHRVEAIQSSNRGFSSTENTFSSRSPPSFKQEMKDIGSFDGQLSCLVVKILAVPKIRSGGKPIAGFPKLHPSGW